VVDNGINMDIPSGYVKIAIENHHWYSGFTHWKMVIFHSYVNVYQRVNGFSG
jgi:hypothetical protein